MSGVTSPKMQKKEKIFMLSTILLRSKLLGDGSLAKLLLFILKGILA